VTAVGPDVTDLAVSGRLVVVGFAAGRIPEVKANYLLAMRGGRTRVAARAPESHTSRLTVCPRGVQPGGAWVSTPTTAPPAVVSARREPARTTA
jgi:hypothetical protein